MKRINLWSSPRNISTALMYSFAQRADTQVVDEPLYAHYLSTHPEQQHPGRLEILQSQENDGGKVMQQMLHGEYGKSNVVFKQMTHHLIGLERMVIYNMKNVLLIRDPHRIIISYAKVIPQPTMEDIGVKMQWELMQELNMNGALAAVVDAKQLLLNPRNTLIQLCQCLEIEFDKAMLSWEKGRRSEDGVWAKYWYKNVHNSTGFQPYRESTERAPTHLEALAEECLPYYNMMMEYAIKV